MTSASTQRQTSAARRASVRPVVALSSSDGSKPRYHAFDALRGMAMFLVIGLHAALAYITTDIPSVLWCIRDAPTVAAVDWFCWWCMSVSNPLYFTIAGFFSIGMYHSRGLNGFVDNRVKRVLIPFLVGLAAILPACLVAWGSGWVIAHRCTWRQVSKVTFIDPQLHAERLGAGHLWFLEYLIAMVVVFGAIAVLAERGKLNLNPLRKLIDLVIGSPWRPFLLAVPTTFLLWISRQNGEIDAVLDRHNSFGIYPLKFLHHASFFLVGIGIYRIRRDLPRLARVGPWYLALSIPVFAARAWFLTRDFANPLHGPSSWGLAASGALFGWLIIFGAVGTCMRIFKEDRPSIRYLADSSYWIYLIHMPILGLIQVDLFGVPGHAFWKIPAVLVGTLGMGFLTYQTLVRYTWLGTALHGHRKRPAQHG